MPTRVQGKIKPLKNRVLVSNMHFGLMKTKSGVILPMTMAQRLEQNQDGQKFMQ